MSKLFKRWRSYKEFLESLEWQKMRTKVMKRDHYTCQICGGKATQVHHKVYSTRAYHLEKLENLIAICDKCHTNIHKNEKIKKDIELQNLLKRAEEVKNKKYSKGEGNLIQQIYRKLQQINQNLEKLSELEKQKIMYLQSLKIERNEGSWFVINKFLDQTLNKLNMN